jgi:hypothetical protein
MRQDGPIGRPCLWGSERRHIPAKKAFLCGFCVYMWACRFAYSAKSRMGGLWTRRGRTDRRGCVFAFLFIGSSHDSPEAAAEQQSAAWLLHDGCMLFLGDCHTQIRTLSDKEVSDHQAAAETVDACIVLGTWEGSHGQINRQVAEHVGRHSHRMVGFAVVDPTEDSFKAETVISGTGELGLKGFVLYCAVAGFHPAHSQAMRFYEAAQGAGLPVFFHNGGHALRAEAILEYSQPHLLDEVARTFPKLKIIIGSMGVPFVDQTLAMVSKHENVFADLTVRPGKVWQTYNIVVAAHEWEVMDKLVFGSGYPRSSAGECIETLLGFNMLLADTKLPTVPRASIRNVIERDSLELLGITRAGSK